MFYQLSGLMHWHFIFFKVHIYSGLPKDNEWDTNYLLACCLEGKKTLNVSLTNDECNLLLIGLMVIKRVYLAQNDKTWEKDGYLFEYYRLGTSIYHFMNIVIGTNLQLQTMARKQPSKVQYFLPHYQCEKLMETISLIYDMDSLLE